MEQRELERGDKNLSVLHSQLREHYLWHYNYPLREFQRAVRKYTEKGFVLVGVFYGKADDEELIKIICALRGKSCEDFLPSPDDSEEEREEKRKRREKLLKAPVGTWQRGEGSAVIKSEEDFMRILSRFGALNIAVYLDRFAVLDIDAPELLSRFGLKVPETYGVRTGRGLHLYFRIEGEEDEKVLLRYKGVIWKGEKEHEEVRLKAPGEYVITIPSLHPSGVPYKEVKRIPPKPLREALPFLSALKDMHGGGEGEEVSVGEEKKAFVEELIGAPYDAIPPCVRGVLEEESVHGVKHTPNVLCLFFFRRLGLSIEDFVRLFCLFKKDAEAREVRYQAEHWEKKEYMVHNCESLEREGLCVPSCPFRGRVKNPLIAFEIARRAGGEGEKREVVVIGKNEDFKICIEGVKLRVLPEEVGENYDMMCDLVGGGEDARREIREEVTSLLAERLHEGDKNALYEELRTKGVVAARIRNLAGVLDALDENNLQTALTGSLENRIALLLDVQTFYDEYFIFVRGKEKIEVRKEIVELFPDRYKHYEEAGYTKKGPVARKSVEKTVRWILRNYPMLCLSDTRELLYYKGGIYHEGGGDLVNSLCFLLFGVLPSSHFTRKVKEIIKTETLIDRSALNPAYIAVENGVIDLHALKRGEKRILPHSPKYRLTNKIPHRYDKQAKCERIKRFFREVAGEEGARLLEEAFAYCLLKENPFQKSFVLVGPTGVGKSTVLELLVRFLGRENCSFLSLREIEDERGFYRHKLFGKLANIDFDLEERDLRKTENFRKIVSGDSITAEEKFKPAYDFVPTVKLFFAANRPPEARGATLAFFRRLVIIPMRADFEPKKRDKLIEELTKPEEMSGLLNLCLERLQDILQNGLSYDKTPEQIQEEYEWLRDSVSAFVECEIEEVEEDAQNAQPIPKDDLYAKYLVFCKKKGLTSVAKTEFHRRLKVLVSLRETRITLNGRRVRVYRGIRLREEAENTEGSERARERERERERGEEGVEAEEGEEADTPKPLCCAECGSEEVWWCAPNRVLCKRCYENKFGKKQRLPIEPETEQEGRGREEGNGGYRAGLEKSSSSQVY